MSEAYVQKMRPLLILEYLQKNSHRDKPVRTPELMAYLEDSTGISCDRKTVYSDIRALIECNYDICALPGRYGGYYIESTSEFEPSELKLLIDAVCSSRYLTEEKARSLVEKLCRLCNQQDALLLKRNVLVSGRVKSMNKSIYYNVDHIQEAITRNKQVRFRYFDWDFGGKRRYRDKEYLASPYGLCQDNDNCYLLAFSPRHGITSYRVDQLTQEDRVPCPELTGKALYRHANRLFQMYSGEKTAVKLRFHESLRGPVIDRFGHDCMLIPDGPDHFQFTTSVVVSPQFLGWVAGLGQKVRILHPEHVVEAYRSLLTETLSQYQSE